MITIVRGSDRVIRIVLKKANEEPLNLTGCTALSVSFVNDDDTKVSRTLAGDDVSIVSPAGAGIIEVSLSKEFTETLKVAERTDFQLEATINGAEVVHIFENALTVKAQLGS